ncbi:MAG: hypothetical protein IJS67_03810, partial [Clostridia bacterium]|nr:hypothetical protein [Clostridia bacterium]
MNRTLKAILIILSAAAIAAGSFTAGFFMRYSTDPDLVSLKFVLDKYKEYYIGETDDYVETMANSILDKYSRYYTPDEYADLQKDHAGSKSGIGLTFYYDTLTIYSVTGNSPAEKAGIVKGGEVKTLSCGDIFVNAESYIDLYEFLSDRKDGEEFTMGIEYGGNVGNYTLRKSEYQETYVYYSDAGGAYRFSDEGGEMAFVKYSSVPVTDFPSDTGYIVYTAFNGYKSGLNGSVGQMKAVLDKFKAEGRKNIIIDLRNNGGGYLDILSEVSAHFIPEEGKKVIIRALYKNGTEEKFYSADCDYYDYGFEKIIFLANSGTASASEALIGAVIDYAGDKVKVVLEPDAKGVYTTYGKGIMQNTFENFGKGEAIRLTSAYLYFPVSGACIHGVGIR